MELEKKHILSEVSQTQTGRPFLRWACGESAKEVLLVATVEDIHPKVRPVLMPEYQHLVNPFKLVWVSIILMYLIDYLMFYFLKETVTFILGNIVINFKNKNITAYYLNQLILQKRYCNRRSNGPYTYFPIY